MLPPTWITEQRCHHFLTTGVIWSEIPHDQLGLHAFSNSSWIGLDAVTISRRCRRSTTANNLIVRMRRKHRTYKIAVLWSTKSPTNPTPVMPSSPLFLGKVSSQPRSPSNKNQEETSEKKKMEEPGLFYHLELTVPVSLPQPRCILCWQLGSFAHIPGWSGSLRCNYSWTDSARVGSVVQALFKIFFYSTFRPWIHVKLGSIPYFELMNVLTKSASSTKYHKGWIYYIKMCAHLNFIYKCSFILLSLIFNFARSMNYENHIYCDNIKWHKKL